MPSREDSVSHLNDSIFDGPFEPIMSVGYFGKGVDVNQQLALQTYFKNQFKLPNDLTLGWHMVLPRIPTSGAFVFKFFTLFPSSWSKPIQKKRN